MAMCRSLLFERRAATSCDVASIVRREDEIVRRHVMSGFNFKFEKQEVFEGFLFHSLSQELRRTKFSILLSVQTQNDQDVFLPGGLLSPSVPKKIVKNI